MRFPPVVVLAVLLACLPGQAVELIDLQATAPPPARLTVQPASQGPVPPPAYFAPYFLPPPALHSSPSPVTYLPPYPAAQWPRPQPFDEWGDMSPDAVLSDQPVPAEAPPPATVGAAPLPVPEPISVLMLACGLLLMVPGAWAARWTRLGDSESLLQRRLP